MVKDLLANAGYARDAGRSLGMEDPMEKKMATLLQYSCPEDAMDRETWRATVHGVTKSWT